MATTKVSELAELTSPDGAEQLLVNDGGTSKRLLVSNLPVGSLGANTVDSDQYVDGSIDNVHLADDAVDSDEIAAGAIDTAHIADDQVTYAKIQNVSATDRILGRDSASAGVIEEITPANLRTMINVEDGADVTDATNVTAAGALMDSECAGLAALKATTGTFLSADESKLDGIEASADVTDATNVAAAGALMDSEVTNLAEVKAFDASDYATAAQGSTADAALPKAGGAMTGAITTNSTFDGVDIATRDGVLTSTTTTANAALPKAGGTMTGTLVITENLASDTQSTPETVASFGATYASTGSDGAAGCGTRLELKIPDDNTNPITGGGIAAIKENSDDGISNAALAFYVSQNDTTLDEFMRLESDGDLHAEGDVIAYSTTISDATLKYNINPVEFALDKIKQLKGVTFNYLKGDKASAGLLAQDVEKVMPSAVTEKKLPLYTKDDKTYKTLHYDSMTAILVEAIKELTAKVEKLENK